MKQIFLLLIISISIYSCAANKTVSKDKANSQRIIGYWGETNGSTYSVAAFLNDGYYEAWIYDSNKKEEVLFTITGKWWIKNDSLFNQVTEINPTFPGISTGDMAVDQIVKISKLEMILIDEEGKSYKSSRVDNPY
ncbi:hypothetical protein [Fulvivirga lutimaris]|uniref:hypothetical protein n=1 Tax=Fulvivirga lutimaris TaxID=1819566 RepID=UPI0012BC41C4|nr:hypothetical protein [Fulvivirga lutimaris]MTI38213.1 hypothetical protein [Fulvivirga lutimaris]